MKPTSTPRGKRNPLLLRTTRQPQPAANQSMTDVARDFILSSDSCLAFCLTAGETTLISCVHDQNQDKKEVNNNK